MCVCVLARFVFFGKDGCFLVCVKQLLKGYFIMVYNVVLFDWFLLRV